MARRGRDRERFTPPVGLSRGHPPRPMRIFIGGRPVYRDSMVRLDITRLPGIVKELAPETEALVSRIYSWYVEPGHLVLTDGMREWVREKYGDIETQQIVRVTNNQTGESTLFNSVRARRPVLTPRAEETRDLSVLSAEGPFANPPLEETPADTFGRIDGDHWVTASNIAKYDYLHAVIIAKEDDPPYVTSEPQVADMISVAIRWCQDANRTDPPRAVYPFVIWNFLWRAGASIVHNHAQVLLTHLPYAAPSRLERVRDEYRCRYGSEYYDDLFAAHTAVGLGLVYRGGARIMRTSPRERSTRLQSSRSRRTISPPRLSQRCSSVTATSGCRVSTRRSTCPPRSGGRRGGIMSPGLSTGGATSIPGRRISEGWNSMPGLRSSRPTRSA
ncbi:hypothetical protein [Methanoculleus chikugoensis]|uniref:hypothetical protein n=1 Tax=Methanoculleus chikugoensis TaxID=118126 RepID=UPI000A6A7E32|nr:hypothetical protein [Methanoculleus chikugoensis]